MIDGSRGRLGIEGSHDVSKPGGRRSLGIRPFLLALLLALALAGVVASPASAQAKARSTIKCTSSGTLAVTWTFSEFPTGENMAKEKIKLDGIFVYEGVFTFNGPSATNTVTIPISPGHHEISVFASWNGNGIKGESDHRFLNGIECPAHPEFTIEKLQKILGSGEAFTASPLMGEVGQTVDYEIIVKDTGNTRLTFSNFTDANCENIAGGPTKALEPGESATYTCEHVLTTADQQAGSHENAATVTATPPLGQGEAITHTSNTVVVSVVTPSAPLTVGYWKTHLSSGSPNTQQHLPQYIGGYKVDTTETADAIFTAMNCGISTSQNAIGCLAGQLLASELNLANGSPKCIAPVVTKANSWLAGNTQDEVPGVVYAGPPVTYTLTEAQRNEAIALKDQFDKYNSGGGC